MRLHATATTKTTTKTKTTTSTTTTKAATTVTKRQRNNIKANTTTARKSRTSTNLTTTNSSNFMRDFLLQIFVLTTFVAACPFSVYPIVTKAMPQTLFDTNTNNNDNNNNNNNNAESAATIKNNAATATATTTAADTLLAAPTIAAHYAKFATDTPNVLLPTLDLDSNEIDNSYFSDYVIANQPISSTTTTATPTKTTPLTVTTTIGTSLNATHINAKSQDLLSLSLLSLNETTTSLLANVTMIAQQKQQQQQHQKIAASHKNAINIGHGNGNGNGNSAATIATVFQQIGAQNIALEPAITSANNNNHNNNNDDDDDDNDDNNNDDADGGGGQHAQHTMHNSQSHSHSHSHIQNNRPAGASATIATSSMASASASSTGNNNNNNSKSNIRTSAKRVDGKYILPKPQKTDAPMLNYIFDTHSSANKHHHHDQRYGPHFEDVESVGQPTNLTVQAGSSIHLNCRISLLHDKTVSWVRRNALNEKDALDLLTVGQVTYTGDKRYKMEFQYPNNWRLKITNVKKDDEAMYECQISTHPPRVIQINLHVNAPKVMIVDEYGDPLQEKYYETDSTLQLSCVVRNVAMASSVVYWKHGEDVLNYDVTRGGVSVKTELMDDGANSTLFIAKINKTDSGNYTCSISDFQNFTIVVHILNGESFAELHHGGAATSYATLPSTVALIILLLYCATLYTEAHIHR